ncbi:hypothetical protein DIJ60_26375 [Burkholderia pseudomallei]|nr:hypothetical protein DIJ60_26375 [Burkholderia pseudomallei]
MNNFCSASPRQPCSFISVPAHTILQKADARRRHLENPIRSMSFVSHLTHSINTAPSRLFKSQKSD